MRITGEVLGEVQVDRAFSRLISLTQDFSEVFEKLGEDIRDIEKEQFDEEGYGWTPLSPAYGAWKALHYPDKSILRRSDRLWQAITQKGALDNVSEVGPLEAAFGASNVAGRRGRFHQLGTVNMPQRKVFDLREEDKRLLTKTFHTYWMRLGPEAGFLLG